MGKMRIKKGKLPILYRKLVEKFIEYAIDEKLKFKQAKHILSWLFHVPKEECWKVLKELERFGAIKIIPNHFIRLNLSEHEIFLSKMKKGAKISRRIV